MKNEYNDPSLFEQEFHLFYNDWIWSEKVNSQIKEGLFTLCKLPFGQEVIMTRSNGVIKAYLNVCPHRKSALILEDTDKLACSFHGWEYDSLGSCTKTPGIDSLKIDRIHLQHVKVENYCDYIFLNFHRNPVPFPTWIERYVTGLPYRPLYFAGIIQVDIDVNWKLAMENEMDGLHVDIVHKELKKIFSCLGTDYYESKITPIKGLVAESQKLYEGVNAVTSDHKRIDGIEKQSVWGEYKIFPHMAPAWMDDYSMVNLYSPISPEKTTGKIFFYVYDEKLIDSAKTAIDLWDSTMQEDIITMEANQRGNMSAFYTKGKILSRDEIGILGVWEKEYKLKMKEVSNGNQRKNN
jgi:phenylpropionate dioxygenase-like ring-hydroxylating dioxygenase large terminal subunit